MKVLPAVTLCLLLAVVVGGLAYYVLALWAVRAKRRALVQAPARDPAAWPGISLLKPLRGADANLAACLESFFEQDYPCFEMLFAVEQADDAAVAVVAALRARHPRVAAQLLISGASPFANPKVYRLDKLARAAKYDLLAVSDSDASVARDYLRDVARAFAEEQAGVVTHLYRGVAEGDLWSRLEALGMSTELMAGVVVAERLEGMKFALGPSMIARRACLQSFGGFAAMADYLADDFTLGQWADRAGWRVVLSGQAVNHHATATGWRASFAHRLFWNRSTRASRPAGYLGQGFTYGLIWALGLALLFPAWWSAALLALLFVVRCSVAWQLSRLLQDDQVARSLWLVPLQDMLSFASWLGGFTGREIVWRNERFRLLRDGRFAPVKPRAQVCEEHP